MWLFREQTSDKICLQEYSRLCLFILSKQEDNLIVTQNVKFDFNKITCHYCLLWGHLQSLLHASKEVTMVLFTNNLPLSPLRWKVLYFLVSRINKLDHDLLQRQTFFICLPPGNHVTMLLSYRSSSTSVILSQTVIVNPGTRLVKNHESQLN